MAQSDRKTVKNRTETRLVDQSTGEVLFSESTATYKVANGDAFVKLHTGAVIEIDLNGMHWRQLFQLLDRMDFDNVIALTPAARVRISEALKMSIGTFGNYLNDLMEKNVLRRTGHGEFMVNPRYFARGTATEIEQRQERYDKIKRVKTREGRKPEPKPDQGNLELM